MTTHSILSAIYSIYHANIPSLPSLSECLCVVGLVSCSQDLRQPLLGHREPAARGGDLHRDPRRRARKVSEELQAKGYVPHTSSALTIRASEPVEASMWSVPEPVAGGCGPFQGARCGRPQTSACSRWRWRRAVGPRDAATVKPFFTERAGHRCARCAPGRRAADGQGARPGLDVPDPGHHARLTSACEKAASRWCTTRWASPRRIWAITRRWPFARRTAPSSSWSKPPRQ